MKKIALFGGSFDPIHTDHVNIIKACYEKLGFDEVWVIPAHLNPFKFDTKSFDRQRVNMIELAIADLDYVKIKEYELNQEDAPSYTYKTALHYHRNYPNYSFSFIIGSDQLDHLEEWDNFHELLKLLDFKVFKRSEMFNETVVARYHLEVFAFNNNHLSSTDVRAGVNLKLQLPTVNDYINHNLLYLKDRLLSMMDVERYRHCLNVGVMASRLALSNEVDYSQALFAGIYHDATKCWPKEKQLAYIKRYFPDLVNEPEPTWHAYSCYGYLKDDLCVKDEAILQAVKNHTTATGSALSKLDKIVFIADKISRERDYPKVEYYRQLAFNNFDQCFVELLDNQYRVAIAKHGIGHIGKELIKSYRYWVKGEE